MIDKPPSFGRIVWTAMTTGNGFLAFMPMAAAAIVNAGIFLWEARSPHPPAFESQAFMLRGIALTISLGIFGLAGAAGTGHQPEERAASRANRQKRWMDSPHAVRLDLGRTLESAGTRDTTGALTLAPGIGVLAQPLLIGLGAACLGFGAAMAVVVAWSGEAFVVLGVRFEIVFWTTVFVLTLAFGLLSVARTHAISTDGPRNRPRVSPAPKPRPTTRG